MSLTLLRRPQEIDFQRALREIEHCGHTLSAIALALNVPRSTVESWKLGITPGYENGRALCILYEQVCRGAPPQRAFEAARAFALGSS